MPQSISQDIKHFMVIGKAMQGDQELWPHSPLFIIDLVLPDMYIAFLQILNIR